MIPNGFMGRRIITFAYSKLKTSLATDVDCSELQVVMETVQAFLKVAKWTE